MLISYHLLLFTDFVPDIEFQFALGWTYVTCIASLIATSMGQVLRGILWEMKLNLHKKLNIWLHKMSESKKTNQIVSEPPASKTYFVVGELVDQEPDAFSD